MTVEASDNWFQRLKDVAHFLPVLVTTLLAISVIREYGYFTIVGIRFLSLLSATDYLRGTLSWLPLTAVAMSISCGLGLYTARADLDFREVVAQDPTVTKIRGMVYFEILKAAFFAVFLLVSVGLIYFISLIAIIPIAMVSAFYMWAKFGRTRSISLLYSWLALALASIVFALGADAADKDLRTGEQLTISNSQGPDQKLVLMRFLDRGALLRKLGSTELKFVPWDDLKSVDYFAVRSPIAMSVREHLGGPPARPIDPPAPAEK